VSTIAFVLLITANRAFAIITGFLPGDACFGTSLSEATLSQFDSQEPVVFDYRTGQGALAGCGYSGYWKLAVRDMPEEMKANLRSLYWELRKYDPQQIEIRKVADGSEQRREANPHMLMIYNKDYDLGQGIGLKLNESWMNLESADPKIPAQPGLYWPYITDYRAVARDWSRGPQVSGLAINEADARPLWGPRIEEPVSVHANQIQILVLPERLYTSFAFGSSHSSDIPWDELPLDVDISAVLSAVNEAHFYRVTSAGVSRCHYGDRFVEQPWPLTPNDAQAESIDQVVESLDRAGTDTFSLDDEQALPAEVQKQLDELREKLDALQEKLSEFSRSLKQQPEVKRPTGNE